MMIRVVLAAFALAQSVRGACVCPSNTNKYSQTYQIATPFDPDDDWNDCTPPDNQCVYTIGTGSDFQGVGHFTALKFQDPEGVLTVVLQDDIYNITITVDDYQAQNATLGSYLPKASVLTVYMFWSKSVTTASALFYGYPVNVTGPSPTTVATAMPTPVTLSGGSPSPAGLLGVDLAIVLDTSVTNSSYFKTMQAVITNAAANLAIYNDDTVPYGARLVLQTMAQTNRPNNFGDPWHIDFDYFGAQTGTQESSTRNNVQRTYAIFTQGAFSDADKIGDLIDTLKVADVHMVVFHFGSGYPNAQLQAFMAKPNFDYVQYKADSPDSFLKDYLVRSDATKFFGCSAGQAEAKTIPAEATGLTYSWPPNYDTATSRYCNNQDFKLSLTAEDGMKAICIVISAYELETEKDYVRFWDASGSLRASLT
ncbi:unnamed protein product, partial [Mesorhabditis spiculigera]